jgi:hypothetical protein
MFRLLFYDRAAASEAADAYDEAQRLDSQYRNERVPIRKAENELKAYDNAEQSGLASQIRAARRALGAAQDASIDGMDAIEAARSAADDILLRREKARLDFEEARRAHEHEQQLYYQHVFPDLPDTARHVFLNLATAGSCLVCGSHSAAASERLLDYAARHQCPICESPVEEQENLVSAAEFSQRRLDLAATKVEELREEVRMLDGQLKDLEFERRGLIDAAEETRREVERWRTELNNLLRQVSTDIEEDVLLGEGDEQIAFKRHYVETGLARLKALEEERTAAELRYMRVKDGQEQRLVERLDATKTSFARIARHLLAEQCILRATSEERRIGEEGERISFPILEVMMSSGVFTGSPSPRANASSVSESQREFIDLAFRMALIEAAAAETSDAMLVIETPEASLDSLFVTEAGELFRRFGAEGGSEGNVFIASTNLNNEGMIPALFGAVPPPEREPTAERDEDVLAEGVPAVEMATPAPTLQPADRKLHLINLLDISAPNAALRQHRSYYEEKLRDAMYADLDGDARDVFFRSGVQAEHNEGVNEAPGEAGGEERP